MHKILVTGSAGFIGYHVALKLIKKSNYKIIGIDNLNNYYDKKLKLNRTRELKKNLINKTKYKFYKIDICDKKKLSRLFRKYKFKKVLHLAAQAGVRFSIKQPDQYINSNLVGFFNILDLCKEYKVDHLVYASSSSVYGSNKKFPFSEADKVDHPIQLYAATKRSNELMADSYSSLYKIPTTGLRFFTVYGPWGRPDMALYKFVKNIFLGKPIKIYNRGKHYRDFTYIEDCVVAIIKVLNKKPKISKITNRNNNPSESMAPFRIINVGNSKTVSLLTYINKIENIIGKKAKKIFLGLQKGDILKTKASIIEAKKILNYKSKTSLDEGLENFINWYKKYNKIK